MNWVEFPKETPPLAKTDVWGIEAEESIKVLTFSGFGKLFGTRFGRLKEWRIDGVGLVKDEIVVVILNPNK